MTRNVKYLCPSHGEFWSSYRSATPKTKGLAPTHAECPTCKVQSPRADQPRST